jgi:hypothetical protein
MPRALVRLSCLSVCLGLLLMLPVSATAKLAPISGKLSKPGYTLIALADSGKASLVRVKHANFKLRPPAKEVTLQLRAPNGRYAGPVVVGQAKKGKRAIVGVRAGAKLGKIDVSVRKGYAKVKRRPAKRWVAGLRWARAKKGVPIGNGRNFGFVRSKPPRAHPLGDLDADGVPDLLDIDLNGNLILNKFDRSGAAARAAAVVSDQFLIQSNLTLMTYEMANADAAGLTAQQTDAALSLRGELHMGILPGDSPELDCGQPQSRTNPLLGGLIYCTKGGTGRLDPPWVPTIQPRRFPDDYLDPATGLGEMTSSTPQPPSGSEQLVMVLYHGATSDQIGTGDLLIQRVTRDGVVLQFPATIQFIFDTVPGLVSYNDGQGNATTVHYPVAAPVDGMGGGPGTPWNPFPVTAGPNGDVTVTFTLWRPQRTPIPPDDNGAGGDACLSDSPPCQWIDIGHLDYHLLIEPNGASCPQDAYSTSDPNLGPLTNPRPGPLATGLEDLAADQPANPANTLTFTVDLSRCFAAEGATFNPGETVSLGVGAYTPNSGDWATAELSFKRQ